MRRLETGDYVFVRRLDDQVKVDGFRIELAEIENVYGQHPLVEQAVVIVRLGKLSAYLKIRDDQELSPTQLHDIKDFVSRSLTYYMVPTYTTVVPSFPKTANGKLDRNALPDPVLPIVAERVEEEDIDWTGERTMEAHVRSVVRDQRGINVKSSSTFAAIGVDSLGAVLLVRALSDSLGGVRIKPERIFRSGVTVRSFADELCAQLLEEHPEVIKKLGIVPNGDVESELEIQCTPLAPECSDHRLRAYCILPRSLARLWTALGQDTLSTSPITISERPCSVEGVRQSSMLLQ